MKVEDIRTLPQGTSLVLLRSAPPIITTMRYWLNRPDAETLLAQRADVESVMRPVAAAPAIQTAPPEPE
jgi:hypothetical protein